MDGEPGGLPPGSAGPGQEILDTFLARLAGQPASRLGESLGQVAAALHGLAGRLAPSAAELRAVVEFLTEVGHATDAQRQEWVLLADVLGLTAAIEPATPPGATPRTGAGPFYRPDAPELALGADICRDGKGTPLAVRGRVLSLDGAALPGALVEVWQANAEGKYENQEPDRQPEHNLRGRFRADAQGRFWFRSVMPAGYALPGDGPVGSLMARVGLGLMRPAHLHFRVTAEGHDRLTTQIFDRADPAIDQDALFGVRPGLLADFQAAPGPRALSIDLVLCPSGPGRTHSGRIA